MPYKCCAPGCRSNYRGITYTPVFKFPQDNDARTKWINKIPRANLIINKNTVICQNHFPETQLYKTACGRIKVKPEAVPTIFENIPKYLSTPAAYQRTNPEERRKKHEERIEENFNQWLNEDLIPNFEDFKLNVFQKCSDVSPWKIHVEECGVTFYILKFDPIPKVQSSIYISSELNCLVALKQGDYVLRYQDLKWILPCSKIERWSQLENLLIRYKEENFDSTTIHLSTFIENARKGLKQLEENLEEETKEHQRVQFLSEQLELIFMSPKRYSVNMIIWSFMIYSFSSAAYSAIRNTENIVMPHLKYMKQLSSSYLISPNKDENHHFIKAIASRCTNDTEKCVIVQMDEIYVNGSLEYKGASVIGSAENVVTSAAKTIQAFMISQPYGNLKEVISLHPVLNMSGDDLYTITKKVLEVLISYNFRIIAIISDNNRVNRNCFSKFGLCAQAENAATPAMLTDQLTLPNSILKPFLTFDSVHVFKNIRNNWLNVKDGSKTFMIPNFDNFDSGPLYANFVDLRNFYTKHCEGTLVKKAFRLTHKALYPTNFERQKVILVCQIFNDTTYCALETEFTNGSKIVGEGTIHFIKIITKWWSIMNIKSKLEGTFRRNNWILPFYNLEDERMNFLRKFIDWLELWKNKYPKHCLTNDTFHAIHQCTRIMIQFIEFSLKEIKVDYVLPGKLQTDNLERRFGAYRQMSGGSYSLSVAQILQSEKKIRMKSLLGLKSSKYGVVKLNLEELKSISQDISTELEEPEESQDIEKFQDILNFDYSRSDIDESSILYVGGYASFKVVHSLKCSCEICVSILKNNSEEVDDYFDALNRGGLTIPTQDVVLLAKRTLQVMSFLISPSYENLFLDHNKQKHLLLRLVLLVLKKNDDDLVAKFSGICSCGCPRKSFLLKLISIFSNISINNYVKLRNDKNATKATDLKKRKLNTLN